MDKPALRSLPERSYEFAKWKLAKAEIDYHVAIDGVYYSVPYPLVGQQMEARITKYIVEIFHKGKRVASHVHVFQKGQAVTDPLHRPKSHQAHAEWTPSRLIAWGKSIGPHTGTLVEQILELKKHPEQGYRACLGLYQLSKQHGLERLEAAAQRALSIGSIFYKSVKSILDHRLESMAPTTEAERDVITPAHDNLRGAAYYGNASKKNKDLLH